MVVGGLVETSLVVATLVSMLVAGPERTAGPISGDKANAVM